MEVIFRLGYHVSIPSLFHGKFYVKELLFQNSSSKCSPSRNIGIRGETRVRSDYDRVSITYFSNRTYIVCTEFHVDIIERDVSAEIFRTRSLENRR